MNKMALFKILKELKDKLSEEENYTPVNWLGKWAKSIKIQNTKNQIKEIEDEIGRRKGVGGKRS